MKTTMKEPASIDFVIPWVDGNDPQWLEEKKRYDSCSGQNRPANYRDWDLLRFWFRGVERHAPWVRRIHFITWGHIPKWLDVNHPKLHIVKHEEYIPKKYLPTFSSHTIELNIHRIQGLSDQFVYFNDDMYLNSDVEGSAFFYNGLPRDIAALNVHCYTLSNPVQMIAIRDAGVINEHFSMRQSIKNNWTRWFSLSYGSKLFRTVALIASPRFPGFYTPHCAQAYLKSSFEEVWKAEPRILDETCSHKFREMTDVNQWLVREWQIANGTFYPHRGSFTKRFMPSSNKEKIIRDACECIIAQKTPSICINDSSAYNEDEVIIFKCNIEQAFKTAYPSKSSFEKN